MTSGELKVSIDNLVQVLAEKEVSDGQDRERVITILEDIRDINNRPQLLDNYVTWREIPRMNIYIQVLFLVLTLLSFVSGAFASGATAARYFSHDHGYKTIPVAAAVGGYCTVFVMVSYFVIRFLKKKTPPSMS